MRAIAPLEAATLPVDEVLARLDTSADGLASFEVERRRSRCGPNVVLEHRVSAFAVLLRQLRNPLLILLVGAAGVSIATGDVTGGSIIVAIVALSVLLGFVNEFHTERTVLALHANVQHTTLAWRDGAQRRIPTAELVVGDLVDLRMGDVIPADVRLVEVNGLLCDESILTGEATPAEKSTDAVASPASELDLPDCAFMGTIVHRGAGRAVVVTTGAGTAFGGIVAGLGEPQATTAFQRGLKSFSKMLVRVAAVLTIGIFVANIALSKPLLDALLFSLAIAIGITPQLLPAIVSVSLSAGSRRLAKRQVLVKRLVTIEDLADVAIVFTDKTGTLTEGAIRFERALDPRGHDDRGLLVLGRVCNEATRSPDGTWNGNDLDVALQTAADASDAPLASAAPVDRPLATLPFDHQRQLSSVLVRDASGDACLVTKGAPEAVLARCTDVDPAAHATVGKLFAQGARVVAVATRTLPGRSSCNEDDETGLRLSGFFTFADPPRAHVAEAVDRLTELGVAVKIVTGDNGAVAAHVCEKLGIDPGTVRTGSELDALDDSALAATIPDTTVFARVSPQQKARIVEVAGRGDDDVAFLGDGVNDAVALHAAHVGISVESARDVAKDAADIVLLDKDLAVVADSVMEGRRTFANTMKYVLMATSSNFGNMFSAAGASLFLSFLPMLPSQILLNNLLYDLGQLAIPTDRVDSEALARPAAWDLALVRRFMWIFGPVSSLFDFTLFAVMLWVLHAGHTEFRTGWFVESLATQTLVVFLIRTRRVPFTRSRPSPAMLILPPTAAAAGIALPFTPLASPLGFITLPLALFSMLLALTITYLLLIEVAKARFFRVAPAVSAPAHDGRAEHRHRVHRRAARFVRVRSTRRRARARDHPASTSGATI